MNIEHEVRCALSRETPPEGFRTRVMSAIEEGAAPVLGRRRWRAVAAAAMLTAVMSGWGAWAIAERRAGERARDDVMSALRIAGEKVHYAQQEVREVSNH